MVAKLKPKDQQKFFIFTNLANKKFRKKKKYQKIRKKNQVAPPPFPSSLLPSVFLWLTQNLLKLSIFLYKTWNFPISLIPMAIKSSISSFPSARLIIKSSILCIPFYWFPLPLPVAPLPLLLSSNLDHQPIYRFSFFSYFLQSSLPFLLPPSLTDSIFFRSSQSIIPKKWKLTLENCMFTLKNRFYCNLLLWLKT